MANKAGFTSSGVGSMIRHYTRTPDAETGMYQDYPRRYGGGHIDHGKTSKNYTIGECRDAEWVHERLKGVYQRPQDKGKKPIMLDIVVTMPTNEKMEDAEKFFRAAYESLYKRYGGRDNVVGCWIHMDEAQPHLHFAFIPVVDKRMKGNPEIKEGISQKAYFPRKSSLREMHEVLQEDISRKMGHQVAILNGATIGGNKSIRELKRESAEALKKAKKVQEDIGDIADSIISIPKSIPLLGGIDVVPTDKSDKLIELADAGQLSVKDAQEWEHAKRKIEGLNETVRRKNEKIAEKEKELESLKKETDIYTRVPEFMRDTVNEDIEYRRNEYRNYADTVNRTVCKLFLDNNKDFRATVKAAGPLLDSIGIPKDQHRDYVKSCLSAVVKQARAKHQHEIYPQKKSYSPPVRGVGWKPSRNETDYDVKEPRPPIAPPPPAQLGGDMLSIDKDWNLMTVFEREELETKAMLRDI